MDESRESKALKLWERYFKEWGEKSYVEDDYGRSHCFFCGERDTTTHAKDCIYTAALELVNKNG